MSHTQRRETLSIRPSDRYRALVLSEDVRFEGWDVRDWFRLLSLFRRTPPPGIAGAAKDVASKGGVIVIHDGTKTRKLLHTRVGRLDPAGVRWPTPLEEIAQTQRASWAVAFHTGALDEVMERFGARAAQTDDITQQALGLAQIVGEMADEGAISAWPTRLRAIPLPSQKVLTRTLDSLCPAGRAVVLGLFDDGELWTSIALRRSTRGIDLIMGPDEIRAEMGLLSGDWRRDYRHLVRAVENRVGPLSAGLFVETSTFQSLLADNSPGAWARAAAVRDIVVSPMSFAIALPLVVDALRGGFRAIREVSERYDPTGRLAPALRALGGRKADEDAPRLPEKRTQSLFSVVKSLLLPR